MELNKLRIMFGSDLDDLTLSTTPSADSGFPATNAQKSARGRFLRVTDTSLQIKASVGGSDAALVANGFAIARHNLKNDATVQIQLFDAVSQGGNVVYDSGDLGVNDIIPWGVMRPGIDPWGSSYQDTSNLPRIFIDWFEAVAYKSVQIDITAASNSTIDIGRLFLKNAFIPRANFSYGSDIEWVDPTVQDRTAAAGLRAEQRPTYRVFRLPMHWLDSADQERLSREQQAAGKSKDVLVARKPNAEGLKKIEQTMVAMRVSNAQFTFEAHNKHSQEMIFEET